MRGESGFPKKHSVAGKEQCFFLTMITYVQEAIMTLSGKSLVAYARCVSFPLQTGLVSLSNCLVLSCFGRHSLLLSGLAQECTSRTRTPSNPGGASTKELLSPQGSICDLKHAQIAQLTSMQGAGRTDEPHDCWGRAPRSTDDYRQAGSPQHIWLNGAFGPLYGVRKEQTKVDPLKVNVS